jgi:hypothetical protein
MDRLQVHSEATDEGMLVVLPQPLSSRRISRTSIRNVYMPSDPGFAGSIANAAELRRTLSNANGPSSRRISRTISSRINADQDWALAAQDGAVAHLMQQQQLQPGFPLHVPAPISRRASRTLSGMKITKPRKLLRVEQVQPERCCWPSCRTPPAGMLS